jgi:hypothetical protein
MQRDSLAHGLVVVEDKVMMFLGKGGKETEDVFPVVSAFFVLMREGEGGD